MVDLPNLSTNESVHFYVYEVIGLQVLYMKYTYAVPIETRRECLIP